MFAEITFFDFPFLSGLIWVSSSYETVDVLPISASSANSFRITNASLNVSIFCNLVQ